MTPPTLRVRRIFFFGGYNRDCSGAADLCARPGRL